MSNNTELPARMTSKSKPVRILGAVAAGATAVAGGLPLLTPDRFDWIGPACGLLGLVIVAGLTKYTEDSTTPWADVAAKVTPSGKVVAGPAADQQTGSSVAVIRLPNLPVVGESERMEQPAGDDYPQSEGYRGETGL